MEEMGTITSLLASLIAVLSVIFFAGKNYANMRDNTERIAKIEVECDRNDKLFHEMRERIIKIETMITFMYNGKTNLESEDRS